MCLRDLVVSSFQDRATTVTFLRSDSTTYFKCNTLPEFDTLLVFNTLLELNLSLRRGK